MNRALITLLLILSVFNSQMSFAISFDFFQDKPEIYEKFSSELDLKTEFTRIIIETGLKIDRENPNLDFSDEKKINNLIQQEISNFGNFYLEKLKIPKEKHSKFKLIFSNLKWEQIKKILKKAHLGVEFIFKKKGFGIGIAIMCGALSEYLVPFALINIGLAKFIPLSMMTPWSVIYSIVPNLVTKIKIQNMLEATLGDKEKVKAYLAQQDEIYNLLKVSGPSDLIIPLKDMNQELEYLVVNQHPWWRSVLSKIGFKPDGISLNEVITFLEDNQVANSYTNSIIEDSNLSNFEKINLITEHIFSRSDSNISDKFRLTFNESINKVIRKDNHWELIWEWTLKAKKVSTIEELKVLTQNLPEQMTSYHLALIWEQILLPEYVKKMDLNFTTSRKLVTDFELYKTKLNLKTSQATKEELVHETFNYLNQVALGHHFKGCKNNPQKIMTYLLSK